MLLGLLQPHPTEVSQLYKGRQAAQEYAYQPLCQGAAELGIRGDNTVPSGEAIPTSFL